MTQPLTRAEVDTFWRAYCDAAGVQLGPLPRCSLRRAIAAGLREAFELREAGNPPPLEDDTPTTEEPRR